MLHGVVIEMTILDALLAYGAGGLVPMHMPGHKRNAEGLSPHLPFGIDVTEVGPLTR